jgi:hypothetical protein
MGSVMKPRKGKKTTARNARSEISAARLAETIEEATVDAHDESEQAMGWFTMFEEYVELPFETEVLGVPVRVTRIDHMLDQAIDLLPPDKLPLASKAFISSSKDRFVRTRQASRRARDGRRIGACRSRSGRAAAQACGRRG